MHSQRAISIALFLLSLYPVPRVASGEPPAATSRITHVLVLGDRAEVTREIQAVVPAGESTLLVDELLPGLLERTLRILPCAGVEILSLGTDLVQRPIPPEGDGEALHEEATQHRGRVAEIEAAVLGLRRQVDLTQAFRSQTLLGINAQLRAGPEAPPLKTEAWDETFVTLAEREIATQDQLRTLELERFRLQKRIEAIEIAQNRLAHPLLRSVRRAHISLRAAAAGPLRLQLLYRVPGPTWRIQYNLRYETARSRLTLEAFGVVVQATGEDWREASLELSNRAPTQGLQPPTVRSLLLHGEEREPEPDVIETTDVVVSVDEVAEHEMPAAIEPFPSKQTPDAIQKPEALAAATGRELRLPTGLEAYVQLETSSTGTTYRVLEAATLPSSSDPHLVPVLREELPASLLYESAPQSSPTVYRRVSASNTTGAPLLRGRASLFLDGDMVGTTTLATIPQGKDLVLSFGAEEGLAVLSAAEEKQGPASELVREKLRAYRFARKGAVENETGRDYTIRVLETIPTSGDQQIQVAIEKTATTPHSELAPGILAFTLKTTPKAETNYTLTYTVTLPAQLAAPALTQTRGPRSTAKKTREVEENVLAEPW